MDYGLEAYKLAQRLHADQTYGGMSYLAAHLAPVELTSRMIAEGCKLSAEELRCVSAIAWLHDIVEDTVCTIEMVQNLPQMPEAVPKAVLALTKYDNDTYSTYLQNVARCGLFAVIVKLADSMCNHRACMAEGRVEKALKYSNNINFLTAALQRIMVTRK